MLTGIPGKGPKPGSGTYSSKWPARLRVKNFLCLKDIDLKFRKLTVLTGENGQGKSVIARLCWLLYAAVPFESDEMCASEAPEPREAGNFLFKNFCALFPQKMWAGTTFSIDFETPIHIFAIHCRKGSVTVSSKQTLREYQRETMASQPRPPLDMDDGFEDVDDAESADMGQLFERFMTQMRDPDFQSKMERFIGRMQMECESDGLGVHESWELGPYSVPLFLPAERVAWPFMDAVLKRSARSRKKDPWPLLEHYAAKLDLSTDFEEDGPDDPELEEALLNLLNITGTNGSWEKEEEGLALHIGQTVVPLGLASSGERAALPMLTIPGYSMEGVRLFIEEPETHLHPRLQRDIVLHLAGVLNEAPSAAVLLTTHSPLVASVIASLVAAHEAGRRDPDGASRIVPERQWLAFEDVACWRIEDGMAVDCMDDVGRTIDFSSLTSVQAGVDDQIARLRAMLPGKKPAQAPRPAPEAKSEPASEAGPGSAQKPKRTAKAAAGTTPKTAPKTASKTAAKTTPPDSAASARAAILGQPTLSPEASKLVDALNQALQEGWQKLDEHTASKKAPGGAASTRKKNK
ncbi:MAG: AAA family ATPase [Desulfovibrionaceae bacterium]|nr:AAA family ATPase [Desulfovibrionaceae bacterium]